MQSCTCANPGRTGTDPIFTDPAQRAAEHRRRVAPHAEAFLARRACGEKHPVWDFLFTYYSFSPGKLMTWMPALRKISNHALQISNNPGGALVFPAITERVRRESVWVAQLCTSIQNRPARFVCHGLQEWAMVYKQRAEQVRHAGHELRMSPEALAAFVESQTVCCTHHDAFRFYTPEARSLNTVRPSLESRLEMEQAGCLHANMDLYKWA